MPQPNTKRVSKPRSYQFFLGVDGGGTKTNIAIMNAACEVVAEVLQAREVVAVGLRPQVEKTLQMRPAAIDAGSAFHLRRLGR